MNSPFRGWCVGLAGLMALVLPAVARAAPAPVSLAERVAVGLVADYLGGGSAALWPRVAPGSRLHSLGKERAGVELSVRLGPASDASWTLVQVAAGGTGRLAVFQVEFPSGIDDLVTLEVDLASQQLVSVQTLAETGASGAFELARLANLRHLLARGDVLVGGTGRDEVETLLRAPLAAGVPADQAAFEASVRRLWLAQYRVLLADAEGATAALASGPTSAAPLSTLLRARIAALQDDDVTAESWYRELLGRLDINAIRWEFTEFLLSAGDWDQAQQELTRLVAGGSRRAASYYTLSRMLLFSHLGQAQSAFRDAWQLEPMERSQVLEDPYLAHLAGRADLSDLLHLEDPLEPAVGPAAGSRRPLAWPAGLEFGVTGEHLLVRAGSSRLAVPAGAVLAPPEVAPEAASERRRRREAAVVAGVAGLKARVADPSVLQSPALVRRMEEAASALANAAEESPAGRREDAWRRLVDLTEVIQRSVTPPAGLVALRAVALWKLGRKQAAVDLLVRLAADAELVKETPKVVLHLAELCAQEGRPDLAARLLRRLRNAEEIPGVLRQIDRFELDQRLIADYAKYQTTNFELRYHRSVEAAEVVLLGGYLESELQRLAEWIPTAGGARHEVHLVPAADFYRVYGGGVGILGLFDGRVRLPVFAVGKQASVMTGVLSHELAHSMIDRATRDCAPKWFHEGLAQLVEPGARQVNPYRSGVQPIAMPLLEPVLRGFSESSMVELAYREAYWALRFVEHRHGKSGIHALLESFSGCRQTAEALGQALGEGPGTSITSCRPGPRVPTRRSKTGECA